MKKRIVVLFVDKKIIRVLRIKNLLFLFMKKIVIKPKIVANSQGPLKVPGGLADPVINNCIKTMISWKIVEYLKILFNENLKL